QRSKGVVFPSLYEGFGLIPFEAAHQGAPCFYAWQTSLRELLPAEGARLVAWDPDASADLVFPALHPGSAAAAGVLRLVREAAAGLTWDRTAQLVVDAYELAVREPRTLAAGVASDSTRRLDELALPDDVYRAFLAVATRPMLRRIFFGLLKLVHRT